MDKLDVKDLSLVEEEGELDPSTLHKMEVEDDKKKQKKGRKHKDRDRSRSSSSGKKHKDRDRFRSSSSRKKHNKKDANRVKRKDTKRSKKESSSPSRSRSPSKAKLGLDHQQRRLRSISPIKSKSKHSSGKADSLSSLKITETYTKPSHGVASPQLISQISDSSGHLKDNVPLADPPLEKYQRKELLPEKSFLLTKHRKSLQWKQQDIDNYLKAWPESMRNLAEECANGVSELSIFNDYAFFAPDDDTVHKCHQSETSRMTQRTGRSGIWKESFIRTHIKRHWSVSVLNKFGDKVEEIPRFLISTRSAIFLEEDGCFVVKRINLSPSGFQLVFPKKSEKLHDEFEDVKIIHIEVKTHCFHEEYTQLESIREFESNTIKRPFTTQEITKMKIKKVLDQMFKNLPTFQGLSKSYLEKDYDYRILLLFNGVDRQEVYLDIVKYFQNPQNPYKVYEKKFIAAWFEGNKEEFLDRLDSYNADLHKKRETTQEGQIQDWERKTDVEK